MVTLTTLKGADTASRFRSWRRSLASDPLKRRPFVYGAIVIFFALYYYRPEDLIRPLAYIPMAKVVGILAFGALIVGIMGAREIRIPKAIKLLWLLLFYMTICIPFALWRGAAFSTVWDKFAKGVVMAMLISMTIVTMAELRKLVWIQLSAVTAVTFLSIVFRHYNPDGRLAGVQESILSNPNDLAINIAITFPLGIAFLLQRRGLKKLVWSAGLAVMALGVVLTASRSGLLALIISILICVWEYGIKGKRQHLVVATILISMVGFSVAVLSPSYRARIESIFSGNVEGSNDRGSREARIQLLKKSINLMLTHPIFGVGPGCFILVDHGWVVAHNAYTEIGAEAGIPSLMLFLLAMAAAFQNIAAVRRSQKYRDDPELRLITQALWAGMVAYMTGSFFASTEYNMYPYFMIGYTCALLRMVRVPSAESTEKSKSLPSKAGYAARSIPQMLRHR